MGDMAYTDGKDNEFQRGFFNAYETTLRHTVCWPTMGNHEGHTSRGKDGVGPYYDAYVVPTRGEAGGLDADSPTRSAISWLLRPPFAWSSARILRSKESNFSVIAQE
jgi:hypothetical protein